jgi:archaellum component FlaG (FlaF/FlaG flagellin family)
MKTLVCSLCGLLAALSATGAGEAAKVVELTKAGKCSVAVGDTVQFTFSHPVVPDRIIHRFDMTVDGQAVAKPEVRVTPPDKTAAGGEVYHRVIYQAAKAGTFKIQITPIHKGEVKGTTREYVLTVTAKAAAEKRTATVGETVFFRFTSPVGAAPKHTIRDFEVVIDGQKVAKPEVKITRPADPKLEGGSVEKSVVFQAAKKGTYRIRITPIYESGKPGEPKDYTLTVSEAAGGKAVGGLEARAEVRQQGKEYTIVFTLKNVSDKPLVVYDWVGDQPLKVQWIGPDGKQRDSHAYKWLEAVRLASPTKDTIKNHTVTLAPGEVLVLGPHGRNDKQGIRLTNPEAGEHRVSVTYVNAEDGKKFGLNDVWVGKVTAAEVVFTVK